MPVLPTRKIFFSYRHLWLCHHRSIHLINPDTVVIASAVRTPWGLHESQLSSISNGQLASLAVEAAVKQAAAPVEQVKQIFMAETLHRKTDEKQNVDFSQFLRKANYTSVTSGDDGGAKALLMALEALKSKQNEFVVVGGMQSATDSATEPRKQLDNSLEKFLKAQKEGLFEEEMIPVMVIKQSGKRKIPQEITQDELLTEKYEIPQFSKGAATLVLTLYATAQKYNITPLAIIKNLDYSDDSKGNLASIGKCIDNLLLKTKLDPNQIHHWEMDDCLIPSITNLDLKFINPHGGSFIFGQSSATSLPRMLTHLTHSLKPNQHGCVLLKNSKEHFSLVVEKIPFFVKPDLLPKLTLYTKDPCYLCDILIEDLEINFSGEYELENIYIDTKENVRFLRLYRHDIPVVFLNNQFLCMHRLNNRLLRRKLYLLKEQ